MPNPPVEPQKLHAFDYLALILMLYKLAFSLARYLLLCCMRTLRLEEMRLEIPGPLLKTAGMTSLLCCFAIAQPSASSGVLSLTAIVQRMEKAQSEVRAQTPYQVIREYRLFGAKSSSANADVVAQVDFDAPTSTGYNIQKWSGSSRGKQIVQRVLDHEVEGVLARAIKLGRG